MKICSACKHKATDDLYFCPLCGGKLVAEVAPTNETQGHDYNDGLIQDLPLDALYQKGCDFELGTNGVSVNPQTAFTLYQKAANLGHAAACNSLGNCYYTGTGTNLSYQSAAKWYVKGANLGHAQAQYNLAFCWDHGKGTRIDRFAAFKWYKAAKNQGITIPMDSWNRCEIAHKKAKCSIAILYVCIIAFVALLLLVNNS